MHGAVLALANIVCVVILCGAWVHVHHEPKSITVTGSARKVIDSDLILWSCTVYGSDTKLVSAYNILKSSSQKVVDFLKTKKIAAEEITIGPVSTKTHYTRDSHGNETQVVDEYELSQQIYVNSPDVDKVWEAARTVTDLIQDGNVLESEEPKFLYTKLADLKIEMLGEATKDATTRAQQVATNSGATLGEILDAKMGVMQINAVHDTDVSDSGVNDTSSRQKEITAVLSARFAVK